MNHRTVEIFTENNDFQYLETLHRNRQKRNKFSEFIIEGVRPINQAIANNWKITAFIYSKDKTLSDWAKKHIEGRKVKIHYLLPQKLLAKISQKEKTSELLALAAIPEDSFARIKIRKNLSIAIFDRPTNPGNLGSSIRSADALGLAGIIITGHGVDLYSQEVITASRGSLFSIPVIRKSAYSELIGLFDQFKKELPKLQIIGADEKGKMEIYKCDLKKPTVIILGNEKWGLSKAYKEICDKLVSIPMQGSASSLNAACSASIFFYELNRQRNV